MIQKLFQSPLVWISVLFVIVVGFFYQTFTRGALPVPADTLVGLYHPWRDAYAQEYPRGVPFKNFLITDPIRQQIPWRKISIDAWKRGEIPTWNPYTFAGSSLVGNIQSGALYPLNIIFLFFDFSIAWTLLIILQPLLGGLFMYLYLKHCKLVDLAAFFGAFVWSFCGFNIAWMTWGTISQTALWFPLLLLLLDHLLDAHHGRTGWYWWGLGFVASFYMMMSAGHAQVALYGIVLCGVYGVWRARHVTRTRAQTVGLGTLISLCAATSLPLWLPQIFIFAEAVRNQGVHVVRDGWFLPWAHLIQFAAPDFFGNPATLNYWGTWNYGEFVGYVGVVGLLLAVYAIWNISRVRFWALVMCISLFLMLDHPITRLLHALQIPLVGSLQPTRLMVLVDLSLAILAAWGMHELLTKKTSIVRSLVVTGGVYAVLWLSVFVLPVFVNDASLIEHLAVAKRNLIVPTACMAGVVLVLFASRIVRSQQTRIVALGFVILLVVDLFRFGWKFTPFTSMEYFFPTTKIIEFLQAQPKPFRVLALDDRILPPNVSSFYGIETIEGYDPLVSRRFDAFLAANEQKSPHITAQSGFNRIYTAHNLSSPLVAFMNVRYVLALTDVSDSNLRLVFQEGQTRVYENSLFLPRVYFAESIQTAPRNDTEVLKALFDPEQSRARAVVSQVIPVLSMPFHSDESIHIDAYEAKSMRLSTKTLSPRFLVVLNSYSPALRAYVDDKITPVYRTNFLFAGLVIPTGSHTVRLEYSLW